MHIFLDIETVLDREKLNEWLVDYHYNKYLKTNHWMGPIALEKYTKEVFLEDRWGLYPELSKICCISLGYETGLPGWISLMTKSYVDFDEDILLGEFVTDMKKFSEVSKGNMQIVWHNIANFDMPFLCKRFMKHHYPMEHWMYNYTKKPWEQTTLDTMNMAKFGGMDSLSLHALCLFLWVKSPKENGDGGKVSDLYAQWRLNDIGRYCEGDVYATRQVFWVLCDWSHVNIEMWKTASRTVWKEENEWSVDWSVPVKETEKKPRAKKKEQVAQSIEITPEEIIVENTQDQESKTIDDVIASMWTLKQP